PAGRGGLNMEVTKRLSQFISHTTFQDLPPPVVHQAKRSVIQAIGAAIAGVDDPSASFWIDFATRQSNGRARPVGVLGCAQRIGLPWAAILNGYLTRVSD